MRQTLRFLISLVLGLLLFTLLATPVQAQSRMECNVLKSRILKEAVHYCVFLPSGYDAAATAGQPARRYPLLYFLHALGDNEQTLINTGAWSMVDNLRQQHKISDFLMVVPEGKHSFFINSANGKVLYSDFFLREFMPAIEAKYRIKPGRGARAVTGLSMGGYGALRLAFAYPHLFSAVSAQSAALITESPHEINRALRSGSPLGGMLGSVFGQPINPVHWEQNNPFALAKKNQGGLRSLAIYFNCGREDEYGFEHGAEALHQQLRLEGVKHDFHLYSGNHGLAYFLTHFEETMVFHSRAFEALP